MEVTNPPSQLDMKIKMPLLICHYILCRFFLFFSFSLTRQSFASFANPGDTSSFRTGCRCRMCWCAPFIAIAAKPTVFSLLSQFHFLYTFYVFFSPRQIVGLRQTTGKCEYERLCICGGCHTPYSKKKMGPHFGGHTRTLKAFAKSETKPKPITRQFHFVPCIPIATASPPPPSSTYALLLKHKSFYTLPAGGPAIHSRTHTHPAHRAQAIWARSRFAISFLAIFWVSSVCSLPLPLAFGQPKSSLKSRRKKQPRPGTAGTAEGKNKHDMVNRAESCWWLKQAL